MLDTDLFDLLDHTADAAFALSDAGEICSWNAAAEALFGFSRGEAIGRSCFDLLDGRGALGARVCTESCHVRDCAARHTPVADFDLEVKTRGGRRMWVNVSTVVHEDGRSGRRRIVHLARNIADRKRTETLVQRMLRTSKQLIEASDASRHAPVMPLSDQEQRVLRSFAEGQSPAEIVSALGISPQTLRNHLHHINQKLGTHNRLEAVIHAMRRRLI
ncbi:MAG: PAS domain S-box protein [Acidobacteria bacterium]|nr:PAS domain S-box protein [Acidobacteriota bacterium]